MRLKHSSFAALKKVKETREKTDMTFKLHLDIEDIGFMFLYRLLMNLGWLIMSVWVAYGFYTLSPLFTIVILGMTMVYGIPMTIVSINSFNETQEIELNKKEFRLTKKRRFMRRQITIPAGEITNISMKSPRLLSLENLLVLLKLFKNYVDIPAIETNNGTFYFGEYNLTKTDRKKLVETLKKTQHNNGYKI